MKNHGFQPSGKILTVPKGLGILHTHTERMLLDKRGLPTMSCLMRIEMKSNKDGKDEKMYLFGYTNEIGNRKIISIRYSWFTYEIHEGWQYEFDEVMT